MKPWSSVTYNPNKVVLATSKVHRIDHELELGVYISKAGSKISKEDALQHVGGYFIGIDFTDRGKTALIQTSRPMQRRVDCLGLLPNVKITSVQFPN
jgi:2-keto-4-pentenoate hydratase/2-oxohepta-3-ene-1,7-dioic acid hydratase in catechol pathway